MLLLLDFLPSLNSRCKQQVNSRLSLSLSLKKKSCAFFLSLAVYANDMVDQLCVYVFARDDGKRQFTEPWNIVDIQYPSMANIGCINKHLKYISDTILFNWTKNYYKLRIHTCLKKNSFANSRFFFFLLWWNSDIKWNELSKQSLKIYWLWRKI